MHELTPPHLDDFMLMRYTVGDLDDITRHQVHRHVGACAVCSQVLGEIVELDRELMEVMKESTARQEVAPAELSSDDPFRVRPEHTFERRRRIPSDRLASIALEASEGSGPISERILEAVGQTGQIKTILAALSLSETLNRFALLYALQGAGRRIADSPVRTLLFADEVLTLLRHDSWPNAEEEAEVVVPLLFLRAQAHSLAGQACNWTGDFEKARTHLELAYRSFARAGCGDEVTLASVEFNEAQRRSFTGNAQEGVLLARRAAATFEDCGMEDNAARARFAEAHALSALGREAEAVELFRGGLPVFEKLEMWSNYVASVNAIGVCLVKLERLDEARREFARALRRLSRESQSSWEAFIRDGLAEVFFAAGRFREAAASFAQATRLYLQVGMRSNAVIASLFEIESWARHGDTARGRHRLEVFRSGLAQQETLDPSISGRIEEALLGLNPDLERIAELRRLAVDIVRDRQRSSA